MPAAGVQVPTRPADREAVRNVRRVAIVAALAAAAVLLGCAAGSYARDVLRPVPGVPDPTPARHAVAAPSPPPPAPADRCAGNTAPQLVLVDISEQHAWLCERGRTAHQTPVTTGMQGPDTATPVGRFRIDGKTRDTTLYPSSGGAYPVRYWITFDAPLYGFHDASWQAIPYGSQDYRTGGSHGCVHMPLEAVRVLYDWVRLGAAVQIRP